MTDQAQSDQVGTGQTGPEYTGGERLGTEQSGTEQSGTQQSGTDRFETDRATSVGSPDRSGSTNSDRGSEEVAPAQEAPQTDQSGDVGRAAEESRAAEEVRGDENRPGNPESTGAADASTPSSDTDSRESDTESRASQTESRTESGPDSPGQNDDDGGRSDEERQQAAEDFAREHDPERHDVSAGEEFRQPGDWTADDAGGPQVWDAEGNLVEGSAPGVTPDDQTTGGHTSGEQGTPAGRRISELDEVRDGGYGVGSAAPLDDGALPLGHPVKAWEDTKTFVTPGHEKYDEADPHVWFTDADAARRAGFRPVD